MSNSNNILQELRQISPFVAGVNAGTPYDVPQGYFEGLAKEILSRVGALESVSFSLNDVTNKNPFAIPSGYFENLADTVLSRVRAMDAASPDEELQALSPLLGQLDKKLPFSVPTGYFDELPHDVVAGANAIDVVNRQFDPVSPLLNEAKNKNVYAVPPGYFDKVAEQVLRKARHGQRPALISLHAGKRLVRYAAAAVIIGIMAAGAWLFFRPETVSGPANELAAIEKLSDDEIVNYIDDNSVPVAEAGSIASADIKEEDIKELLSDVSDQELQQYLDRHAVAKDLTIN